MDPQTREKLKSRLASLPPEQREHLLQAARLRKDADRGSIQDRFERQAALTPDAIAVRCGTGLVTYAQLDERACRIGARLLAGGLPRGGLVALTMDRGTDLIAALLGILKAGGAYVPIDPAVPESRQAMIREDANAAAVVTQTKYARQYDGFRGSILAVDELPDASAQEQLAGVQWPGIGGSDLAYVIYTSGSTGMPKGVMVEHRNVVRLFDAADTLFEFSASDVWTLFHSYAFDFSVWEIWGALFHGATLVVVPFLVSRSPQEFAALLHDQRVTVLNQTPSAFSNVMPQLLARDTPGSLRHVIFGGEALDPRRLAPWLDRFGDERPALINMYGITETTVHVTYKRLRRKDIVRGVSDIGAPLPHVRLYLLNEQRSSVPEGAVGELYVAGAGVSRGYLNRSELNAARFVTSPSLNEVVLYKTGDLARRLEGGVLEYLGRNDDQVKLRGFRIELAEIERQLLSHVSVRDAVACLSGEGEERQLIAYVVLSADAGPHWRSGLLAHLRKALPDYMVPARPVALQELPLTGNGKVDRAVLPQPQPSDVWFTAYEAPTSAVETLLCRLFGEVLQVDRVGIRDNFFSLGGDSLKTVNLIAKAKAAALQLTIADLFENPCIAELAQAAARTAACAEREQTVAAGPFDLIAAEDRERLPPGIASAYPMSSLQQGMIFHNLQSGDNSLYHNVISQHYRGHVDFDVMRRALQSLMAVHDMLRTSLHMTGYSEPLQLVHENVVAPLFVHDIRHLSAREQEELLARELVRIREAAFVLTEAPLFAAHVYLTGSAEFELIWLEHHAILDGWSLASFMTQLTERYAAALENRAVSPAVATGLYRDYIAAERAAIADPAEVRFWQQYLEGATFTRLQSAVPPSATARRRVAPLELPPALFEQCQQLAASLGVALKAVFLAAYAKVIARFSNEPEILVGITTHGRPDYQDSSAQLGLYVSTHPLRLDCSGCSWRELIQRCWRAEAQIWPHRYFPVSRIKRLRAGAELFETSFTYNNFSITREARDIGVAAQRERRAFELDEIGLGVAFIVTGSAREQCQVHVTYEPGRFDETFARRVQSYLLAALESIAAACDNHAEVLAEADRDAIAALGRVLQPSPATFDTLVSELEHVVRDHGARRAVEEGAMSIDFSELDRRSTLLAAQLHAAGIEPGTLVGFDCTPSIDMVAGILAVLKRGAAFVPLDPEQPDVRLAAIVHESGLKHVLTTRHTARRMPLSVSIHCLEDLREAADSMSAAPAPAGALSSGTIAYVMYTSGSTGKPKGVAVTHGNAVSLLRASQRRYGCSPGERVLQFSNIGFDIFIEELLDTVFAAGTLVIVPRSQLLDVRRFWKVVDERRISLLNLPTAFWNVLCADVDRLAPSCTLASLRTCVVGGEAMLMEPLRRWLAHFGKRVALWNAYGPAEATSIVAAFDTRELLDADNGRERIPIGTPLSHASCWILGHDLRPVPVGVIGELYVAGLGVAQGYLHDPEQTKRRFMTLAVAGAEAQRLYATGDRVRANALGQLEFIGRTDHQVKIRGFRVEIEEVQHIIGTAAGVNQCAVVAMDATSNPASIPEQRLVAYVVLQLPAAQDGLERIVASMRQQLPGYMHPSDWVVLDRLPLTVNGKVDVRALPAPAAPATAAQAHVPAETATELQLQALWEGVLGRPQISVDADFFAVGGHSLLLTRLLLQIGETFDVAISMAELLRRRTIREMARLVDGARELKAPRAPMDESIEIKEW